MPELDELEPFAREGGRGVVPPDFEALVQTSRRRSRVKTMGSGAAAVLVLGLAVAGVRGVYDDQTAPVGPAHAPTGPTASTPAASVTRATSIVDSERARPYSAVVLPDRPAARAVMWGGTGDGVALAVTPDGFQSRTTLLLRGTFPKISPAGADWFFVAQPGLAELVSPEGARRSVLVDHTPGPLQPGEYLVPTASGKDLLAVDPTTATAHTISLPPNAHEAYGGGDLIWTIAYTATSQSVFHSAVHWSTDGGRSWSSHALPSGVLAIYTRVPSPEGTMVVSRTGDVTAVPLSQLIASDDLGATWRTTTVKPRLAVKWTAVLPDGTLVANLLNRPRAGAGPFRLDRYSGLVSSVGRDWSQLVPVHPALPEGQTDMGDALDALVATSTDHGTTLLWTGGGGRSVLLMSSDGGRTWTMTPER